MNEKKFDWIVIGSGIYGSYFTLEALKKGLKVGIIDIDSQPFHRASYVNQARLHNGYHYPRSYKTALTSKYYFEKFAQDFAFSLFSDYQKIYAIPRDFSWVNGEQFQHFCDSVQILCQEIKAPDYMRSQMFDGIFETKEWTIDYQKLGQFFIQHIKELHADFFLGRYIQQVELKDKSYRLFLNDGTILEADKVLNATYAGINGIHDLFGFEKLSIKYELCEVILCQPHSFLKKVGITVMDGPFFSTMPFNSQQHSLTSVNLTPHQFTSDPQMGFDCQQQRIDCTYQTLQDCLSCSFRPQTAWDYMNQLVKKYLTLENPLQYQDSLYTIKTILKDSEVDDGRPTILKRWHKAPDFYTVFSGKLNTIYELNYLLEI